MSYRYLLLILFFPVVSCGLTQKVEDEKYLFLPELVRVVNSNHLSPRTFDQSMSSDILNSFLSSIDPEKKLLTSKEVDNLTANKEYITKAFESGDSQFFNETMQYRKLGLVRAKNFIDHYLSQEIDISIDEFLELNSKKVEFAKDEIGLKKRWRLIVKKRFLEDLYLSEIAEPDTSLLKQKEAARKKTVVFFDNYFSQLNSLNREDLQQSFANAYVSQNDYQSSFLFPKDKAEWDVKFHRTFVGVGMSIETTLDYPRITNVVFDGPTWKTKQVKRGDSLLKIANEEDVWIDVAGLALHKVLDLLKGENGSIARIIIKNLNNEIKQVEIPRGQVDLPKVMSYILKKESSNRKVGYIRLPRFYGGNDGCASHILQELELFHNQNIEEVIFDLRDNIGGSVREAISIIEYFLNGGILMQAKYADGRHRVFEDEDESLEYSGKLIVLVNERSSSASELFAGTMQDYNRAVIVGSQTFGKGTIQRFIDVVDKDERVKYGDVKLTLGSFYTGLGRSTQYNGIMPDILLANNKSHVETGERAIKNALKFEDLIGAPNKYEPSHESMIKKAQYLSKIRLQENEYFIAAEKAANLERKREEESLESLNYTIFKSKKDQSRQLSIGKAVITDLVIFDSSLDDYELGRKANWKDKLQSDHYVYESLLIMDDLF